MSLSKRGFLHTASVAGMSLGPHAESDAATAEAGLYDLPKFGNVSLLHMTDCRERPRRRPELRLRSRRKDGPSHPGYAFGRKADRGDQDLPRRRVVAEEASKAGNRPVWKLVEAWLKSKGSVGTRALNTPRLIGIEGNPGLASV